MDEHRVIDKMFNFCKAHANREIFDEIFPENSYDFITRYMKTQVGQNVFMDENIPLELKREMLKKRITSDYDIKRRWVERKEDEEQGWLDELQRKYEEVKLKPIKYVYRGLTIKEPTKEEPFLFQTKMRIQ